MINCTGDSAKPNLRAASLPPPLPICIPPSCFLLLFILLSHTFSPLSPIFLLPPPIPSTTHSLREGFKKKPADLLILAKKRGGS